MTPTDDRYVLPPDVENDRLRSLGQLHLSHDPEDRFGFVTKMARVALGVPMSAINLVDRDWQWCKEYSADHELHFDVPREQSVCRATIARAYQEPADPALIFEDLADSEFAELPAVAADGGVRFYAGYPLFGPGGHPVGTFCVYDTRPRRLSTQDRATFGELAAWAQRELRSSDDLQRAAQVQQQLLPPPLGDLPGYTVATAFEPAYAVGGDFYDHARVQDRLSIALADVMGKGLGSAILAANVRSTLRAASRAFDNAGTSADLSGVIATVDEQLADDFARTGTFVTLFLAQLEATTGTVRYVDAGHGISALLRQSGGADPLKSDDLPLGIISGDTWTTHTVVMDPGDILVVASDGLLDLLGEDSTVDDVLSFLATHRDPSELCRNVRNLAAQRLPIDDITMIALRRDR